MSHQEWIDLDHSGIIKEHGISESDAGRLTEYAQSLIASAKRFKEEKQNADHCDTNQSRGEAG
jgi:hypothetical protein